MGLGLWPALGLGLGPALGCMGLGLHGTGAGAVACVRAVAWAGTGAVACARAVAWRINTCNV